MILNWTKFVEGESDDLWFARRAKVSSSTDFGSNDRFISPWYRIVRLEEEIVMTGPREDDNLN